MKQSSPEISFDNRLLAIEEQFRQRKYSAALHDLSLLTEAAFVESPPEYGLYLSLAADGLTRPRLAPAGLNAPRQDLSRRLVQAGLYRTG